MSKNTFPPHGQRPPVVTIVYKSLPHYRIPFFEALRLRLDAQGIELRLIYGQPSAEERKKQETGNIAWGYQVHNYFLNIGSRYLCWQPCLRFLKDSDLVIVEQQSKMLNNYVLLLKQLLGGAKLAFWGHGRNFMGHSASSIGEALKRTMSRHAHWWFAYNELGARVIRELGFSKERVTIVQNAIDTTSLQQKKAGTDGAELSALRAALELKGNNVAIFVGGLYAEKRLDFLVQAVQEIRKNVPDFELLVLGAGPHQHIVDKAAQEREWIHYLGPKFNEDKVPFFMISKLMLMPGAVGLGLVDSFALEVPIVTIDLPYHGPEIEYLIHGVNGLKLDACTTPEDYAAVVTSLLRDAVFQERLRQGCRIAAKKYTLEAMVERFTEGVIRAVTS